MIHVSAQQPLIGDHLKPGLTCGVNGIHFDRGNTWFRQGGVWIEYLTRSQALLQQGQHVADVMYFQGDDSPHGTGPFLPGLPEGYDFDACGGEGLARLLVRRDGLVVSLCAKTYRYLVLPSDGRMTTRSLDRVARLLRAGATVVGSRPTDSPSLGDAPFENQRDDLLRKLWGDSPPPSGRRAVGKGRLIWGQTFTEILAADRLPPDFAYDDEAGLVLHAVHRQVADNDVYFVANASQRSGWIDCRFRVSNKTPDLWQADTGHRAPAVLFSQDGPVTRVPLFFEPAGSVFVVFRPGPTSVHATDLRFSASVGAAQAAPLRIVRAA